jgi:hypothetical protein
MSKTEPRPVVWTLRRCDKFLHDKERIAELGGEEGIPTIEYPLWSPYDAHAAAATLLQLLEQENARAT